MWNRPSNPVRSYWEYLGAKQLKLFSIVMLKVMYSCVVCQHLKKYIYCGVVMCVQMKKKGFGRGGGGLCPCFLRTVVHTKTPESY